MMPAKGSRPPTRLYFFPALIPLGSLLAGLLTFVGASSGFIIRKWKHRSFTPPERATAFATTFLGLALYVFHNMPHPDTIEGTRMIPSRMQSRVEIVEDEAAAAQTQQAKPNPGDVLHENWSALSTRQLLSTPTLTDEHILVGTRSGTLEVYSRKNAGKHLFTVQKREPIFTRPVVQKGIAYFGEGLHSSANSRLTALYLKKRRILWEREFLGHLEMAPALDPKRDRLYLGAGPSGLWAMRASDGRLLWHAPIGHVDSTPLITPKSIISPAQIDDSKKPETQLLALNPSNAEIQWRCHLPGQPWGSPMLDPVSGDILVTTSIGQLDAPLKTDRGWSHAVDAETGRLKWTQELPTMPLMTSTILEPEKVLLHTLKNGELVALKLSEKPGTFAWTAALGAPVFAPATQVSSNQIAVVTQKGVLSLRDTLTGKEIYKTEVGPNGTSAVIAEANQMWVATPEALAAFTLTGTALSMPAHEPAVIASAPMPADPNQNDDDPEDELLPEAGD